INKYRIHMRSALSANYERCKSRFLSACASTVFINPLNSIVETRLERTDRAADSLLSAFTSLLEKKSVRLCENTAKLDALSPLKVMNRGYAFVTSGDKAVKSVEDFETGETLNIRFTDGVADCKIIKKERLT
ncbi:MAG: hypothetical protein II252_07035, partial [Clostridia bacterium]|nr:hypothetical protein [Clostridia bacterium]